MALELEIIGATRELHAMEEPNRLKVAPVRRLRESHHAVAKLCARGVLDAQISLITGYSTQRIADLRNNDPSFRELVSFYGRDQDEVAATVESQFLALAQDTRQALHERVIDHAEDMTVDELLNVFKASADRAGYSPVQRTISKNLNLNIAERLDAARGRK